MLLEHRVLVRGQLRRLAQDDVRDADLADVVEQAGELNRVLHLLVEAHASRQEDGVAGDVLRVALRVSVLCVDRDDESLEHVEAEPATTRSSSPTVATRTPSPPLAFASPSATAAADRRSVTDAACSG